MFFDGFGHLKNVYNYLTKNALLWCLMYVDGDGTWMFEHLESYFRSCVYRDICKMTKVTYMSLGSIPKSPCDSKDLQEN